MDCRTFVQNQGDMKQNTLDLKVPKGWQMCSTRELEMIAEEILRAQMIASLSRFRPFDWLEIKTRLFFRFAGVDIVSVEDRVTEYQDSSPDIGTEEQVFVCRLSKKNSQFSIFNSQFELKTWQVHSFLEQLSWLDATDSKGRPVPMPKMMWPYPKRIWWLRWRTPGGELLDGMTWQTYRLINDWMEAYTMVANQLVEARQKPAARSQGNRHLIHRLARIRRASPLDPLIRQERDVREAVLALIFGCKKWRIRLARISEVEWQVIMFWWSSMMQYLKEQYPKCFKAPTKRTRTKQQPLPIELYTRSMATLQKYLGGLTEDEINRQTAHAILRHLNDMAVEAEEMEKIRKKHR